MNKHNERYLNEARKFSDKIATKFLMPLLFLIFFMTSPLVTIILTLVLSPLLFILIYDRKIFSRKFLNFSFAVYLTMSFVYSCLPRYQYQSFRLFHPGWTEVAGKIVDYKISWTPATKQSAASSYASITYTYQVGGKEQRVVAPEAITRYSGNVWNTDADIAGHNLALKQQVEAYMSNKNFKILVNEQADSKLFIPLDYVTFWGSFYLQLIVIILKVGLTIGIVISLPFAYTYILERVKENRRRNWR
ncbi:hypothetical protein [Sphingobacterium sp.]|uniref:hypothetical protein n=1 Tax=Sphingobacterium sp. TaxID=341027 RepID=UPI0031E42068